MATIEFSGKGSIPTLTLLILSAYGLAGCGGGSSGSLNAIDGGSSSVDATLPDGAPPEVCGDGVVSGGEACDVGIASGETGACPSSCPPSADVCEIAIVRGEECDATCDVVTLEDPVDGDGCCPAGTTEADDDDCETVCGDGVVTGDERCDTAITDADGECPASCEAIDACHPVTLVGTACEAECITAEITAPIHGDSCCPPGADATSDDDCVAICGNGVVEPGETCEGAGCPTSCVAPDACTPTALIGDASSCDAACVASPITTCVDDDGCCPAGCDATSDDDCSASCGNGVVEPGETCDPPDSCPVACDDMNACTTDALAGSSSNCNAQCTHTPIVTPDDGTDGCCPPGANNNTDPNCPAVCGNGVTEEGELCDAACPETCAPSNDPCHPSVLVGTGCQRQCASSPIVEAISGDGCCLPGDTYAEDTDCPGICGNLVVETGEDCDDGNAFAYDGCDECQFVDGEALCLADAAERGQTGPCVECQCGSECRDAIDLCYNSTDYALAGPAAGTRKSELCAALIECGRGAGCTGRSCFGSIVLGACLPEVQAAAETVNINVAIERQEDLAYAIGRANAIGQCTETHCSAACL